MTDNIDANDADAQTETETSDDFTNAHGLYSQDFGGCPCDDDEYATDGGSETDADGGGDSRPIPQGERNDIVWVAESKDSDWSAGPYNDHLKAIDEAHEHNAQTGEDTETKHRKRSEVDEVLDE
jgi:hypothetical protein